MVIGIAGDKTAMVYKKLYDEATEEIMCERNAPPSVEKYCTEYDGSYGSIIEIKTSETEEEMMKQVRIEGIDFLVEFLSSQSLTGHEITELWKVSLSNDSNKLLESFFLIKNLRCCLRRRNEFYFEVWFEL